MNYPVPPEDVTQGFSFVKVRQQIRLQNQILRTDVIESLLK